MKGWTAFGILMAYLLGLAAGSADKPEPRAPYGNTILVGTGCAKGDMRTGIAVAWEEDELPICEAIDIHTIERPYRGR